MCRKVRQKGRLLNENEKIDNYLLLHILANSLFAVNGNWRYLRSCAWLGEPGVGKDERYCIHRTGTYNIHVEYCTCR